MIREQILCLLCLQFYEMYDDDKIGDIPHVEIDGYLPVDNVTENEAVRQLLGIKEEDAGDSEKLVSRVSLNKFDHEWQEYRRHCLRETRAKKSVMLIKLMELSLILLFIDCI